MNPQGTVASVGFCVADTSYSQFCDRLARLPEVRFTSRRRFFVFAANVRASFDFRGHAFLMQPDPWDGTWWVVPSGADERLEDLHALHEQLFGRIPAS